MKDISPKATMAAVAAGAHKLRPYLGVGLFLLFAAVYGYLVLKINSLSNPTIDVSEVISQAVDAPTPRIDAQAAEQLLKLKDNSVNVQTLFEEGRKNPFQE